VELYTITNCLLVQVILRPTFSRPVYLGTGLHMTRFLLLSNICDLQVVGRLPWREDGSVIYSYNSLSLSGRSPAELMTTSYCLTWSARSLYLYPPGTGWLTYTPGQLVPFLSPLTTRRPTMEVFYPASTWVNCLLKLKLKLSCDRRSVGQSVLVPGSQLEILTRLFFCLTIAGFSIGAPSLTRGWVCNLLVKLLLGLERAVTLRSKSRKTHGHILLSHLRLPQPGGPGLRIYIPQRQGGPVTTPGTEFTFRCLLRLAGYSNPSPHESISSSRSIATDCQSASSSRCRDSFGAVDQIFNFFEWQLFSFIM
jgi:hypothetical protein